MSNLPPQMSYPRITAAHLEIYTNRHITIVGKIMQLRGPQATLDSEGSVTILLNRVGHLPSLKTSYMEPYRGRAHY